MTNYRVKVERLVREEAEIHVEAASRDEARAIAKASAVTDPQFWMRAGHLDSSVQVVVQAEEVS